MPLVTGLPQELLTLIFSFFFPPRSTTQLLIDLIPLQHTCRVFRDTIKNNHVLWDKVWFEMNDFTDSKLFGKTSSYLILGKCELVDEGDEEALGFRFWHELFLQLIETVVGNPALTVKNMSVNHPPQWNYISIEDNNVLESDVSQRTLLQAKERDKGLNSWTEKFQRDYASVEQMCWFTSSFSTKELFNVRVWDRLKTLSIYGGNDQDVKNLIFNHAKSLKNLTLSLDSITVLADIKDFAVTHQEFNLEEYELTNVISMNDAIKYNWDPKMFNFSTIRNNYDLDRAMETFNHIQYLSIEFDSEHSLRLDSNLSLPHLLDLTIRSGNVIFDGFKAEKLKCVLLECKAQVTDSQQVFQQVSNFSGNFSEGSMQTFALKHKWVETFRISRVDKIEICDFPKLKYLDVKFNSAVVFNCPKLSSVSFSSYKTDTNAKICLDRCDNLTVRKVNGLQLSANTIDSLEVEISLLYTFQVTSPIAVRQIMLKKLPETIDLRLLNTKFSVQDIIVDGIEKSIFYSMKIEMKDVNHLDVLPLKLLEENEFKVISSPFLKKVKSLYNPQQKHPKLENCTSLERIDGVFSDIDWKKLGTDRVMLSLLEMTFPVFSMDHPFPSKITHLSLDGCFYNLNLDMFPNLEFVQLKSDLEETDNSVELSHHNTIKVLRIEMTSVWLNLNIDCRSLSMLQIEVNALPNSRVIIQRAPKLLYRFVRLNTSSHSTGELLPTVVTGTNQ